MKSGDLNEELARRLVKAQFPQWASLPIRAVEESGHDNRTFRLGSEMSIRLPSAEPYAKHVSIEHKWLPKIASHMALPITEPVGIGLPDTEFQWPWSVNRWISGRTASRETISDLSAFAVDLADFLNALQAVPAAEDAPKPGPENFHRGGNLILYDKDARGSARRLSELYDLKDTLAVWEEATCTKHEGRDVWIHGDFAPGNLIVSSGRLKGVIDFGQLAVGDPSCDLVIAWTFLSSDSREVFRERLKVKDSTWIRGRGWALWKALITIDFSPSANTSDIQWAKWTLNEILADYNEA